MPARLELVADDDLLGADDLTAIEAPGEVVEDTRAEPLSLRRQELEVEPVAELMDDGLDLHRLLSARRLRADVHAVLFDHVEGEHRGALEALRHVRVAVADLREARGVHEARRALDEPERMAHRLVVEVAGVHDAKAAGERTLVLLADVPLRKDPVDRVERAVEDVEQLVGLLLRALRRPWRHHARLTEELRRSLERLAVLRPMPVLAEDLQKHRQRGRRFHPYEPKERLHRRLKIDLTAILARVLVDAPAHVAGDGAEAGGAGGEIGGGHGEGQCITAARARSGPRARAGRSGSAAPAPRCARASIA